MKSKTLQPFKEPPPPAREACWACQTFTPECLVPVGDEAVPMCWLCAHHVTEHDTDASAAHCAECACPPQAIYPHRMFDAPGDLVAQEPAPEPKSKRALEREKLMQSSREKIDAWVREAHKQMSASQLEAVKRRVS
jgi:hypothetical protein